MRKGILGLRKKLVIYGGIGFRGAGKGIKKRKTVCGHKIHERISQINLKVIKQGNKPLTEIFGVPSAEGAKMPEEAEGKGAKEPKTEKKKEESDAKEEKAKEEQKALEVIRVYEREKREGAKTG